MIEKGFRIFLLVTNLQISDMELPGIRCGTCRYQTCRSLDIKPANIKLTDIRYATCRYQIWNFQISNLRISNLPCRYQIRKLRIEAELQHRQAHQDPLALEMPRCPSHPAKSNLSGEFVVYMCVFRKPRNFQSHMFAADLMIF